MDRILRCWPLKPMKQEVWHPDVQTGSNPRPDHPMIHFVVVVVADTSEVDMNRFRPSNILVVVEEEQLKRLIGIEMI